jgi:hypothetical protein
MGRNNEFLILEKAFREERSSEMSMRKEKISNREWER